MDFHRNNNPVFFTAAELLCKTIAFRKGFPSRIWTPCAREVKHSLNTLQSEQLCYLQCFPWRHAANRREATVVWPEGNRPNYMYARKTTHIDRAQVRTDTQHTRKERDDNVHFHLIYTKVIGRIARCLLHILCHTSGGMWLNVMIY